VHVLVTSGGTREPIDDVRVLTNRSTGRLGAHLTDALLERGHRVTLLHGVEAVRPRDASAQCLVFETSLDLAELLQQHVPQASAVFHAAAVADYLPQRNPGKLSSDAESMTLQLTRAPKLVDRLRVLAPDALLVGFKLTSGGSEQRRVDAAQDLRIRARLDLVLANDAAALDHEDHVGLLVGPEGIRERFAGKEAIAAGLAELLS
jgi:phosphopantothenoylcysteine synthetase/decarboxylase